MLPREVGLALLWTTRVDFSAPRSAFEAGTYESSGSAKYSGSDLLEFLRMKSSDDELIDWLLYNNENKSL